MLGMGGAGSAGVPGDAAKSQAVRFMNMLHAELLAIPAGTQILRFCAEPARGRGEGRIEIVERW
jgi:hypothetical protein